MTNIDLEEPAVHDAPKGKRTFRGRSKNGCVECRTKHYKCDEQEPVCGRCKKAGQQCTRPKKQLERKILGPSGSSVVVPPSLGNPLRDPNSVFEKIGAPQLRNLDSLVYWLSVKTPITPGGYLGHMTKAWIQLISETAWDDPAWVSMNAFNALRLKSLFSGENLEHHIMRAELSTIKELQRYKKVTAMMLLTMLHLAQRAGFNGEVEVAEAHMKAAKRLYKTTSNLDVSVNEWLFLWGVDTFMATTLHREPLLPCWIPPSMCTPLKYSAEAMSKVHRMAAKNAIAVQTLAGDDYLNVSWIFQELHLLYDIFRSGSYAKEAMPFQARMHPLARRTLSYLIQLQREAKVDESNPDVLCRLLLGVALQSCTWRFILPPSADDGFDDEKAYFRHILRNLNDVGRSIIEKLQGPAPAIEVWIERASTESLIWIVSVLALDWKFARNKVYSYWIDVLELVAHKADIKTSESLRAALHRWPYQQTQIDTLVREFELSLVK